MIGKTIQGYRVDAMLGEGGMGKVYLATDLALDRQVAIKNLNANLVYNSTFLERFTNEARILSRLSHPNIALLYNYLQEGSDHYMVMEYVEGDNMDAYVRKYGTVAPALLVPVLLALLDGLNYAHRKGVLHRDIKPANLMLTPQGAVKIMDFGIARVSDQASRLTKVQRVIGTLDYLAPELIQGAEPSPASDCYALGVVAYELATGGTLPFTGTSEFARMQAIIHGQALSPDKLNKALPKKLANIILQAMDSLPETRFRDAGQFRDALTKAYPNYREIRLPEKPMRLASTTVMAVASANAEPTRVHAPRATQLIDATDAPLLSPMDSSTHHTYVLYAALAAAVLIVVALALLFWPRMRQTSGNESDIMAEASTKPVATGSLSKAAGGYEGIDSKKPEPNLQQLLINEETPIVDEETPKVVTQTEQQRTPKVTEDQPKPDVDLPENEQGKPAGKDEEVVDEAQPRPTPEGENKPIPLPSPVVLDGSVTVNLLLQDRLEAESLKKGMTLSFSVTKPVVYKGYTIIPEGAKATAEISRITSKQVSIRFKDVTTVNNRTVPFKRSELSGKIDDMLASPNFVVMLEKGVTVP